MSATIPALSLLAFLLPSSAAAAEQTIPATVKSGLKVAVVDDVGGSVEGRVQEVSDRFVRLAVEWRHPGHPRSKTVVRIEQPDTVKNGALIGLGIGVTMGLIAMPSGSAGRRRVRLAHGGKRRDLRRPGCTDRWGTGRRRTLYERGPRPQARLHPVIGRHVRGVAATVEW